MIEKNECRRDLRASRRAYVAGLPDASRALILLRPPVPVVRLTQGASTIGLYHPSRYEAPTRGYARWFGENGCRIGLPWFADRHAAMDFREWQDPGEDAGLEPGPWGALQPRGDAPRAVPDVAFVPLLGFTADGHRLGQGGGHYDRWLDAHPTALAFGLGWDCQFLEKLPLEPHDRTVRAIITPTRIYGDMA